MHDKVTRLRQIMSEALPRPTQQAEGPESAARAEFAYFQANAPTPLILDQSPKAKAIREIWRIATWYGWVGEVERALDRSCCVSLEAMDDEELGILAARMRGLEDCVHSGADSPYAPPAR